MINNGDIIVKEGRIIVVPQIGNGTFIHVL
jgi:hypothetical protein